MPGQYQLHILISARWIEHLQYASATASPFSFVCLPRSLSWNSGRALCRAGKSWMRAVEGR
eukprot:11201291-Lingulodinium_polyedra.AAC.1